MMRVFNAFQAVAMFAATPFGLAWLDQQTFRGASIGFWVGVVIYIIAFILNVTAVSIAIEKTDKRR